MLKYKKNRADKYLVNSFWTRNYDENIYTVIESIGDECVIDIANYVVRVIQYFILEILLSKTCFLQHK